ncbi:MAG: 2TM domain-containing protein [Rhodospirillales bacterium]
MPDDGNETQRYRRRLKTFGTHMIGYFVVMVIVIPLNMMTEPDNPWFIFPMIGWGSVLALHAAYVMGLFKVFDRSDDRK